MKNTQMVGNTRKTLQVISGQLFLSLIYFFVIIIASTLWLFSLINIKTKTRNTQDYSQTKSSPLVSSQVEKEIPSEIEENKTKSKILSTLNVEFNEEFKLEREKVRSIINEAYEKKYETLEEVFEISPQNVTILVLDDYEAYISEVQSELPEENIPNGATYLVNSSDSADSEDSNGLKVKVVIYTAKLDNLPAIYNHTDSIINHELVHVFQMNYLNDNLYSKPLWLIEAQAQYYENPLKYGNYSKSDFSSLADIEFGLVSQDSELRSSSYAIAKDFYEYLLSDHSKDDLIRYLKELPPDIEAQFQEFLLA